MVKLETSSTAVLAYRTPGSAKGSQSLDRPCRTIMALVKAAKNIRIPPMPIQTASL